MEKMEMTTGKPKMVGEIEEMEMWGGLYKELVEEILNRIPIKPLIRMKCLSKCWCRLISDYRLSRPCSSDLKFLFQYEFFKESQVVFLDAKEQGGEIIEHFEHESLSFSINHNLNLRFYGASNGLLLFGDYKGIYGNYVCNPTLNQWVHLPRFGLLESNHDHTSGMGVAFDGLPQDHYKVVCFDLDRVKICTSGHLECVIFSSDVCSWSEHKSVLLNSCLVEFIKNNSNHTPYFYRKGMIHWVLDVYMLVYHIQKDFFKLIKLPIEDNDYKEFPRLWESEGSLHISYSKKDKLHICAFVPDNNADHDEIAYMKADQFTHGKWELKHILEFTTLKALHPEILTTINETLRMCFEPCGFNEDSQVLYIRLPGMIVSYSFETKTLKKTWTFRKSGNVLSEVTQSNNDFNFGRSFCMRLTGVNLPLGGDSKLLHPKKVSQGSVGRPLLIL